jgi:hypothetical protein
MSHNEIVKEKMKQYAMDGGWGTQVGIERRKKRKCIHIIAAGDIMTQPPF